MKLIPIDVKTGKVVEKGDSVVNERGDVQIFSRPLRARGRGLAGTVLLDNRDQADDTSVGVAVLDLHQQRPYLGGLPEPVIATYNHHLHQH
ncbi:hypothetical protein [Gordonia malaquae]|uniref:hypothetical protein n=1 Tax=Gordonia malaquae TaxID=410332 RepID=UPI00301612CF